MCTSNHVCYFQWPDNIRSILEIDSITPTAIGDSDNDDAVYDGAVGDNDDDVDSAAAALADEEEEEEHVRQDAADFVKMRETLQQIVQGMIDYFILNVL